MSGEDIDVLDAANNRGVSTLEAFSDYASTQVIHEKAVGFDAIDVLDFGNREIPELVPDRRAEFKHFAMAGGDERRHAGRGFVGCHEVG